MGLLIKGFQLKQKPYKGWLLGATGHDAEPAPPNSTLYFVNATNTNWNTEANWWQDIDGTVPALRIPEDGDSVHIESNILTPAASLVTLDDVVCNDVTTFLNVSLMNITCQTFAATGGYISGFLEAATSTFNGGQIGLFISYGENEADVNFNGSYVSSSAQIYGNNVVFQGNGFLEGSVVANTINVYYPMPYPIDGYGGTVTGTINYYDYVFGCTDPSANNYNPSANTDDGTCEYGGGG